MQSPPRSFVNKLGRLRRVKIGIRAEDPQRIWERRAPLTPEAVSKLTQSGRCTVEVVASPKRVFPDREYAEAGASIVPALTDSNIVLGIKEPPLSEIDKLRGSVDAGRQTHLMFSHTIKGQPYNMPLLAKYVSLSQSASSTHIPRLVDYELITNESDGKRTVGFGWFAGVAGVLESLSSMAHSHLKLGYPSPFLYTPRPHTLPTLKALRKALKHIGSLISINGTPKDLGPFIIGLTGNGQVSQGCLSMLSELPIQKVKVEELDSLISKWKADKLDLRKIYLVHVMPEDYLVRVDGGEYDRAHYYQSPQSYMSMFGEKIAPYLTLFLNGTGWSPSFPRLMTNAQLEVALTRAQELGGARFTNIGDISCDVNGGLEFLSKATTLSSPSYEERPENLPPSLPSVQMMSVDILPASLPLDASNHFSSALEGHVNDLVEHYLNPTLPFPSVLERATVASQGKLHTSHHWLHSNVERCLSESKTSPTSMARARAQTTQPSDIWDGSPSGKKKILILGSGMVAGPAVDLIAQSPDFDLVIASDSLEELRRLTAPHAFVKYRLIDASKPEIYAPLVKASDVVISLLPADMHGAVGRICIEGNTHLITASYMSNDISKLHKFAQQRGVLILTEMGLDPGLDHLSAMDMFHKVRDSGRSIVSFTSFCGGIPVPEDSNVPLGYKFSWRPQGVLLAARNKAIYLLNNKIYEIPGKRLLQTRFPKIPITSEFELEGLPNRDSLSYRTIYRTEPSVYSEHLRTFMRGTLRYPGYSSLMNGFATLGFLDDTREISLGSWDRFLYECSNAVNLDRHLSERLPAEDIEPLLNALEWLGLHDYSMYGAIGCKPPQPPVPDGPLTPLNLFAFLLSHKLKYAPNERDMVVLAHEFITKPVGKDLVNEDLMVHSSRLIVKGKRADDFGLRSERPASAMARTVGLPVAVAAMLVAEGKIKEAGVIRPIQPHVFQPILEGLDKLGIYLTESVTPRTAVKTTVEDSLIRSSSTQATGKQHQKEVAGSDVDKLYQPPRDLDDDRTWDDELGTSVVHPSSQY